MSIVCDSIILFTKQIYIANTYIYICAMMCEQAVQVKRKAFRSGGYFYKATKLKNLSIYIYMLKPLGWKKTSQEITSK